MSEPKVAVLDIDEIHVEAGFNPRTEFDPDKHRELVASMKKVGIIQALTVRPDGRLIAGERRLRAARDAGLKRIPVLIREKDREKDGDREEDAERSDALEAALVENLIRADLNPVEKAYAFLRLAELEGLKTNKQVAARVEKSASYVGDLKRMLKLPAECLPFFASEAVPLEAERNLRRIAEVSPRIAVCACELAQSGKVESVELVRSFDNVLYAVSRAKLDDPPTMIEPEDVDLSQVIRDEERRSGLLEALMEVKPFLPETPTHIRFGQMEIDAARAAGCLVEIELDNGGWVSTTMFITDRELAGDLAERCLERLVKEAREEEERRVKAAKKAGKPTTKDEEKEARETARGKAKIAKTAAERFNEGIGRKLIERRGAAGRKEHGLNRAKAVAAILLADHDGLAPAGIRLVLPQLRDIEHKTLKSGEKREKVVYADPTACREYLWNRIEEARSEGQVIELLTEAIIAGELADDAAIPQSHRVGWFSQGERHAIEHLSAEVKAARPRRTRAAR
jgi:ParB family transcriptional regulator, chromosome partitioning protein